MREEGLFRVTDSSTDAKLFIEKINRGSYTFLSGAGLLPRSNDSPLTSNVILLPLPTAGVEVDLFAMNKPHLMAMLLKAYLRELRRPLIVPELFSKFISVNGTSAPAPLRLVSFTPLNELRSLVYPDATPLEYVKDLLGQLPKDHIALLKCLLKLLHRVASEETSKMNAHNLGTRLSGPTPSFFCDREGMRFIITTILH